jgi:hypothetical protein
VWEEIYVWEKKFEMRAYLFKWDMMRGRKTLNLIYLWLFLIEDVKIS